MNLRYCRICDRPKAHPNHQTLAECEAAEKCLKPLRHHPYVRHEVYATIIREMAVAWGYRNLALRVTQVDCRNSVKWARYEAYVFGLQRIRHIWTAARGENQ